MANMTNRARVQALLQALFTSSTPCVVTPGTGGGSVFQTTPPFTLRLMSANGSPINTANGTELPSGSGYTTGGASLGAVFCAAPTAGVAFNSNSVSWAASGTWPTVNGVEVWDSAGAPLRWLQGSITAITGVVNGDTVQFSPASLSIDASQW